MEELTIKDKIESKIAKIKNNLIKDKKHKNYYFQQGQLNGLSYVLKIIEESEEN